MTTLLNTIVTLFLASPLGCVVPGCSVEGTDAERVPSAADQEREVGADVLPAQERRVSRWRDPREVVWVEDEAVASALEIGLGSTDIPGGIGAIAHRNGDVRIGAFGVRKDGADEPVTVRDVFHIGSDTKAMTATLVARLVERELLGWDSTIEDVLPDLAERIDPAYRAVTITQLLRHTSGAPANARTWRAFPDLGIRERRIEIAAASLAEPPKHAPGSQYLYSNLGYMVAGAMTEAVRDASWETLIVDEVFEPLGMGVTGFGVPGTKGSLDAPWGHVIRRGRARPVQADNDPALGPAGTVYLSIDAWARFVLEFTDAAAKDEGFLSAGSREKLVEVGQGNYAFGWIVTKRPWAGGAALTHSGSNTMWFSVAWVAPRKDKAYLVAVNAAGDGVSTAVDRAVASLIQLDEAGARGEGR